MMREDGEGGALSIRVTEGALHEHHRRMKRIGAALLVASIVVPVAAILVAVELSFVALMGALGVVLAIDMLLRARRGLAAQGDLVVTIHRGMVTYGHEHAGEPFRGGAPSGLESGPFASAQAFPDHVQIVLGRYPGLRQLEIPVDRDERARVVAYLRAHALVVGERMAVAPRLALCLTVLPALVAAGVLAYRAVLLVALAGVVVALQRLGPVAGLTGLALLSALGLYLRVRDVLRRRTPNG
jgi:hypothetical protein